MIFARSDVMYLIPNLFDGPDIPSYLADPITQLTLIFVVCRRREERVVTRYGQETFMIYEYMISYCYSDQGV